MRKLEKIMRWLFPAHYSEVAECAQCGDIVSKTRMVNSPRGWFCNEKEADDFWYRTQ
jgi:hypothetical protein